MKVQGLVEVDNHKNEQIELRDFFSIEYNDILDEKLD